jgi:hypothetical protein
LDSGLEGVWAYQSYLNQLLLFAFKPWLQAYNDQSLSLLSLSSLSLFSRLSLAGAGTLFSLSFLPL